MNHCTWKRVSWQINSIRNSFGQQEGLPFVNLLTPAKLREVAGQAAELSELIYTPLVTLWMFLSQMFDADHSCRQAVARLLVWLTLQGRPACCAETGTYAPPNNDEYTAHAEKINLRILEEFNRAEINLANS